MTDEEVAPYYVCFTQWLGFVRPHVKMRFAVGAMGVEEITPSLREWAVDITNGEVVE